ncbi:Rho termination factor N-terminal domain-containing protein [Planococcus faecalis]|uniref:Rho termination factor-like N-terminal domain-containing protein n=1 Tax=Planococcus faecalis TaxID=1598147 RepID=A0ABN4XPN8_9BACL|nr:Rho termination factor N-terminal domain-containing protein [Planococcus faecalis]AQU79723.1 hypothetical protein AJGP001_10810 [Planococcus faecalis]OHX52081.1 hypothetical protein BB777_14210 [Planococcus faecalis]
MPKYTSNAQLVHRGSVVGPEKEIELTVEQAKRLGDKVTAVEVEKKDSLSDKTVPELKEVAKDLEIEDFDGLKKAELIQAIEEKQKVEA